MPKLLILLLLALIAATLGCSSEEKPPSTPLETFKTYTRAIKKKDITTMKILLSSETLKMHEQEAKSQGITVDDIVKRETLFSENQSTVEFRNEKIDGDKATLEQMLRAASEVAPMNTQYRRLKDKIDTEENVLPNILKISAAAIVALVIGTRFARWRQQQRVRRASGNELEVDDLV